MACALRRYGVTDSATFNQTGIDLLYGVTDAATFNQTGIDLLVLGQPPSVNLALPQPE
ncbi:MAG: hypothetical protein P8X89_21965 [Reinekea sp.]